MDSVLAGGSIGWVDTTIGQLVSWWRTFVVVAGRWINACPLMLLVYVNKQQRPWLYVPLWGSCIRLIGRMAHWNTTEHVHVSSIEAAAAAWEMSVIRILSPWLWSRLAYQRAGSLVLAVEVKFRDKIVCRSAGGIDGALRQVSGRLVSSKQHNSAIIVRTSKLQVKFEVVPAQRLHCAGSNWEEPVNCVG